MKTNLHTFELVKFFADGRAPLVLRTRLTEGQAKSACNAPSTRKAGEWFIGYRQTKQRLTRPAQPSITAALVGLRHGLGAGRENFTPALGVTF